jgi:hypothetical protein
MIAGSSGRDSAVTARDHAFSTEPVSDGETKEPGGTVTTPRLAPLWQTDSVTFGRIIIGWRVGT